MKFNRSLLRIEAKKFYKEQTKNIPKKERMPFHLFFKKYIEMRSAKPTEPKEVEEDFDLSQVASVNDLNGGDNNE